MSSQHFGKKGEMAMIKKVGIIGRGAVGTLFAQLIQKQIGKENLYFIPGKDRYATYVEEAFYCNDEKCDFHYVEHNEKKDHYVDLLLIVVKYPTLVESIESCKPFIKDDTIILCLLNGITSEAIVEANISKGVVLHSIAQLMDAVKVGNQVTYTKTGEIVVGTNDAHKLAALESVTSFFDKIQFPYRKTEDIVHDQYSKLMLNCGINQVCAVYDVGYGGCKVGAKYHSIFVSAMKEVQMVANAEGIAIRDEEVDM